MTRQFQNIFIVGAVLPLAFAASCGGNPDNTAASDNGASTSASTTGGATAGPTAPTTTGEGTTITNGKPAGTGSNGTDSVPPAPGASATKALAMGVTTPAGPFQVRLSTAAPKPKIAKVSFTATIMQGGKPVKNATSMIILSMPSMGMKGPHVALTPVGDHYEGSTDLSMSGDWQADVSVNAGGKTGAASYKFTAVD